MGALSPSISLLTREWIGIAKFAAAYSIVYLMLRLGGICSTFIGGMDYAFKTMFISTYTFAEIIAVAAAVFALITGIMEIRKRRREQSPAAP